MSVPQLATDRGHIDGEKGDEIAISYKSLSARTRYSAAMTLTRLVLLVMAVMIVIIVARTMFGSRR
jgi:hypothetical protein